MMLLGADMPDQADVEQALASFIAGALYPEGEAGAAAVGTLCRVYRGFPVAAPLEQDLLAGVAHVTVQPIADSVRTTTRYASEWVGAAPACPLMAQSDGVTATFNGVAGPGLVAGVLVDGKAYVWRVTDASTPGIVAAVLADMVRSDRPATLSGTTVAFPGARQVVARAVSDGEGGQELRRQEARFRVTLWCPSPDIRDTLGAFVDLALAGVAFLDVGGWGCRVRASGGVSHDEGAAVPVWRRDLVYRIEYPTVLESRLPAMLFGAGSVNGSEYYG